MQSTLLIGPLSPTSVSVPLQALTKASAVYVETRRRILTGALAPGSAVNQEALAADLGVSITPLREALRRLEMEGLIRLEAHRTMIISPLTRKELDEMYAIRSQLDPFAAGLAAENASEAQLKIIERLARQETSIIPARQLERNREFHHAVYSSCGNGALISLLDQLWDRTGRYRLILIKEELIEGSTSRQEHIEIANAIIERRVDLAVRLMRSHIQISHVRIASFVTARAGDGIDKPLPKAKGSQ